MNKEKIFWKSEGLSIFGEMCLPGGSPTPFPTLIVCHGIPGKTKGTDDPGYPALAERFCREGFLTVIFNFRGTGASGGNFDLLGWARDLEDGLDCLRRRSEVDRERLYLMGFSGGGAVSIYVAARRKEIAGVISCASPADFDDLLTGRSLTDFLTHSREVGIIRDPLFPPSLPEWEKTFETVKPIRWIDRIPPRPLLLIQGKADDVVDPRHARLLYEKVKRQADLYEIEGAGHRLRLEERAMRKALEWMKKTAFGEPGQNRVSGVGCRE
jgi:dipeptidyl aminopeptidase/acylaminoacyl peptidase